MKRKEETIYYRAVMKILNCKTKEEALKTISIFNLKEKRQVKTVIDTYARAFPEEIDNIKKLRELYDEYLFVYLEDLKISHYIEVASKSKYLNVINKLLDCPDMETCMVFLKDNGVIGSKLKLYMTKYQNRFPENINEISKVEIICSKYLDYLEEQRKIKEADLRQQKLLEQEQKKMELADMASEVIMIFVKSKDKTIGDFCDKNNINITDFNNYVNIVKNYCMDVYQLYDDKLTNLKKERYVKVIDKVKLIIEQLKNGVKITEDSIRVFDILDYHLLTNLTFEELIEICEDICDLKELRLVRTFVSKSKVYNLITKNQILDSKHIIGGYEVTLEDKILVIDYLEQRNILLSDKIYSLAIKRYISGELVIINDKSNILKLNK